MGLKYKEKYKVAFYESDVNKNMKLSDILALALQISGEQSFRLNRSDEWIWENYHVFWAVIEHDIDIVRFPKFSETITIETEATSYNKFFCYRDFWIKDAQGETLIEINSTWVIMDKDTRKVKRVNDKLVEPYEAERISEIIRPHKFEVLDDSIHYNVKYPIRFSDLDINGHVNNAKYYDWAVDQLSFDFRMKHQAKKVYIRYNHEIRYGEQAYVEPLFDLKDNKSFHVIRKDNVDCANIEIEWAPLAD